MLAILAMLAQSKRPARDAGGAAPPILSVVHRVALASTPDRDRDIAGRAVEPDSWTWEPAAMDVSVSDPD